MNDWLGTKGCGCYGMSTNSSSLVIQHVLSMTTPNGDMTIPDFSSLKFSKIYLNGEIPGSCKLYMLQLTEASMSIFEAVEDCINLINCHEGFPIVG